MRVNKYDFFLYTALPPKLSQNSNELETGGCSDENPDWKYYESENLRSVSTCRSSISVTISQSGLGSEWHGAFTAVKPQIFPGKVSDPFRSCCSLGGHERKPDMPRDSITRLHTMAKAGYVATEIVKETSVLITRLTSGEGTWSRFGRRDAHSGTALWTSHKTLIDDLESKLITLHCKPTLTAHRLKGENLALCQ